ncbi:MAG: hypothetical protein KAT83_03785 [Candidatus Aenigmarchaeota archaeon]|nr:hypothetical protein [Candidatus Aenigmarchaeota archaeon]
MVSSIYRNVESLLGIDQGNILPLLNTTKKVSPEAINGLPPEARSLLIREGVLAMNYLNGEGVVKEGCNPVLKITDKFVDGYFGG